MSDEQRMAGKRVLVSGSDTGIGRGVALEFARAGAAVALHYPLAPDGAESAAEEIRQAGGQAQAFHANFNDLAQVRGLAAQAIDFLGGLDVLVNNAGITMNLPFEEVTPEQFDTLYNVNIRGMFFLTQAALPALSAQRANKTAGVVINLASIHAFAAMTEHTVYAGTKGAILAFTRVLALELSQKGVRVNAIAPGWILVENHLKAMVNFDEAASASAFPAGFIARPSDVGKLAIFLASDEARYIVGQTLQFDGGQSVIMPLTGDFRERRQEHYGRGYVPGLEG
jgi:NAD(P)-dependent dehydrogenase (short-subunit alcohol dehydrogenase family)